VIPGTFLGLVALAAALGPGYLYVRRAELHHNRPVQSQLGELVEMVVIGGACSLIAAGAVLGVVHSKGWIDTAKLHQDAGGYLLAEPWRCFAAAVVFYALAYGLSYAASKFFLRNSTAAIVPGATAWTQAMRASLPKGKAVSAMVELRDGRKLAGVVASFTSAEKENRELVLCRPIKASGGPGRGEVELSADFITLREEQIALFSGRYVNTEK
jgi:hypothetical protein